MTNQTARVLELLKRFNDGKIITIESLKNDPIWFKSSEKTIRRDLDIIKKYFPESFERVKDIKGAYKAITKEIIDNFIDERTLSLMVIAYNLANKNSLFESFNINKVDKNILKNKLKSTQECYEFITKPFEDKNCPNDLLKKLEFSVRYKRKLLVYYKSESKSFHLLINPYKIVFINENFYLASESEYGFSMLRVQNIQNIELKKDTFYKNQNISSFIKSMQTPFAKYSENFTQHQIHIKLQISKEKARFFKQKKFFSSQKLENTQEDGSVVISYEFSQNAEIIPFILSWLPYIKVLEPQELKNEIIDILKKAKP